MSEPDKDKLPDELDPTTESASVTGRLEALERINKDEDDSHYKERQLRLNKWLTGSTVCLAVLNLLLVLTSLWATYVSKMASDAAKKSADIASATLANSIQSTRNGERAWVEIEPIKPIPFTKADGTFGASFLYEIYLRNVGKTVARDIVMHANRALSGPSLGNNADQVRKTQDEFLHEYLGENNRMIKVLAPNAVSPVPFRLNGQEPQIFTKGAMYSFLIGRIDYMDAFSIKHFLTFCFFVGNGRGELFNCIEGNDEDRNTETPEPSP